MFANLKFKYKLSLLPLLATLSLLGILALTLTFASRNGALFERIERGYAPALALSRDLTGTLRDLQRALQDAVASEDEDALNRADAGHAAFRDFIERGREIPTVNQEKMGEMAAEFEEYYAHARATSLRMMRKERSADFNDALSLMASKFGKLSAALADDAASSKEQMAVAFAQARASQRSSVTVSAAIIVLCLALMALLSVWIVSGIATPLQSLTRVASRIASEGDLTQQISIRAGDDEVGILAKSFQAVVDKLRTIPLTLGRSVADLGLAVDGLNRLTSEQNASTTRQAAGLAQASVTTQELRQTSTLAAEKARQVLEIAARAEEFSAAGQASVEKSLRGLGAMSSEIEGMIAKIGNLSGSASRIGEIIGTVKDMADQSNMLALNAAIAAVKAGESGKEFAVIAREIRSLSDQSIQSTVRVREILGEIEGAIRGAVAMTETGGQRMEQNLKEIRASGESLREIGSIVETSSQAVRQIAASVSQQAEGVAQITTAIGDLNGSMQQSVEGIHRVEEAVDNLRSTAGGIQAVIATFRI